MYSPLDGTFINSYPTMGLTVSRQRKQRAAEKDTETASVSNDLVTLIKVLYKIEVNQEASLAHWREELTDRKAREARAEKLKQEELKEMRVANALSRDMLQQEKVLWECDQE
ncbi:hypothetical protein EUX98_g8154 [Antrodiella citrinella]|uniref:Uncharacterized protein n=1 Tax=Antrodiella citrinella TaxID=2447956 RepID=A0A4S4MD50_9APHY|nr:hypothetical protein EUX98_g8154 [Antrodiella citrinella]